ncbi:MAG: hypothetical protein ABR887_05940 [Methanoregulaceae archaeon]
MTDAADDVVCSKKFAHGGVRGLQFGDHLALFHFVKQLLQVAVKD